MFTRFSLSAHVNEVVKQFRIDKILLGYQKGELLPTQPIPVMIYEKEEKCLDLYTWGMFPCWAKDSINAPSETVHEKPAYRRNFTKNRCVIPCDGFYGETTEGKTVKSVKFSLPDRKVFGLAGMYDVWKFPDGTEYRTCTLLTTSSNRVISEYFDRMPVILDEDSMERWLNPRITDKDDLLTLMRAYETEPMTALPQEMSLKRRERAIPH
jgi:putative SOS response-associated peptidase YedK